MEWLGQPTSIRIQCSRRRLPVRDSNVLFILQSSNSSKLLKSNSPGLFVTSMPVSSAAMASGEERHLCLLARSEHLHERLWQEVAVEVRIVRNRGSHARGAPARVSSSIIFSAVSARSPAIEGHAVLFRLRERVWRQGANQCAAFADRARDQTLRKRRCLSCAQQNIEPNF